MDETATVTGKDAARLRSGRFRPAAQPDQRSSADAWARLRRLDPAVRDLAEELATERRRSAELREEVRRLRNRLAAAEAARPSQ